MFSLNCLYLKVNVFEMTITGESMSRSSSQFSGQSAVEEEEEDGAEECDRVSEEAEVCAHRLLPPAAQLCPRIAANLEIFP